jgi:hypothetical protein
MGAVVSSSHPQTLVPISSQNYTKNATISGAKSFPFGKSQWRNNLWRLKWLNTLIPIIGVSSIVTKWKCNALFYGCSPKYWRWIQGWETKKESINAHTNMHMIGMFKCQLFCKILRFSNSDISVAYNKQVIGKRLHTSTQWSQRT